MGNDTQALAEHSITALTPVRDAGAIWLARLERAGLDYVDADEAERDDQRHHSRQTIASYHTAVTLFVRWFERSGRTGVGELQLDDLRHYVRSLRRRDYDLSQRAHRRHTAGISGDRLSPRTLHSYVRPLLGLFSLLESFDAITFRTAAVRSELAYSLPRLPETVAPTPPDLRRLATFYDQPRIADDRTERLRLIRLRNAALLHILFSSGARVSEVLGLNIGDVYRDRRVLSRVPVRGKGRQDGVIFIRPAAERALGTYLAMFVAQNGTQPTTTPLFLSFDRRTAGMRLSRSSAWRIVHTAATAVADQIELEGKLDEAALLRAASPHTFRHFVGFYLLNEGADLAEVSQILRHRSVEVTRAFYARYKDIQLQEVHDQFSADPVAWGPAAPGSLSHEETS